MKHCVEYIDVNELSSYSQEVNIFYSGRTVYGALLSENLYPPLPVAENRLIWGFHILRYALQNGKEYGISRLPCRRVSMTPAEQIKTALRMENRTDHYSSREKAALWKLIRSFGCTDAIDTIAPLVQREGDFTEQAKKIESLPPPLQESVHDGLLDIKTAEKVKDLPEEVLSLTRERSKTVSFACRRVVLIRLLEIARRDALTHSETAGLAKEIFESGDPDGKSESYRFPALTKMDREFFDFKRDVLGKKSGIRLDPPPHFEGGAFDLSFRFSSKKQLAERIKTLQTLAERCDELFRLLY